MKLRPFKFALACLLAVSGMVGCSPGPKTPILPSQSAKGLVEKLTIEQLAARADSVLVGEVSDIGSYKGGEGNIYTLTTISVEQTIKGETRSEVVVTIPGGEADGQTLWVEDAPSFQLGERVAVFLTEGEGVLNVIGGSQGKFSIDNNNMVIGNMPLADFINRIKVEVDKGSR